MQVLIRAGNGVVNTELDDRNEVGPHTAVRSVLPQASAEAPAGGAGHALEQITEGLQMLLQQPDWPPSKALLDLEIPGFGGLSRLGLDSLEIDPGASQIAEHSVFCGRWLAPGDLCIEGPRTRSDAQFLESLREQGLRILGSQVIGQRQAEQRLRVDIGCELPLRIEFAANHALNAVDVWLSNFPRFGSWRYRLPAAQVDSESCEALRRFVRRESDAWLQSLHYVGLDTLKSRLQPDGVQTLVNRVELAAPLLSFRQQTQEKCLRLSCQSREHALLARKRDFTLGRALSADLRIGVLSVSRLHAYISFRNGNFYLTDRSSNGTFLREDGKPEIYLHGSSRMLSGQGAIALGEPTGDALRTLIEYAIL